MRYFHKILAAVSASAALVCAAGQAQAATWLLDYTATNNAAPFGAILTLVTDDLANGDGSFNVTDISGTVDNGNNTDTVTGLIDNPNKPGWAFSPDNKFMFDNLFAPTSAPALTWYGLLFTGASGDEYNLFSDNASTYELYRANPNVGGYPDHSVGTVSISAIQSHGPISFNQISGGVPEPAAWALMILGFGATGLALRRRRRSAAAH
jgi:hypothetical protein